MYLLESYRKENQIGNQEIPAEEPVICYTVTETHDLHLCYEGTKRKHLFSKVSFSHTFSLLVILYLKHSLPNMKSHKTEVSSEVKTLSTSVYE